jgi:hypothetical protein
VARWRVPALLRLFSVTDSDPSHDDAHLSAKG